MIRWRWGDPLEVLHDVLTGGGVVAVPTESSYGLAVEPDDPRGVAAVYSVKRRSPDKPLPVVIGELGQLRGLGIDPDSDPVRAAAALWPAPLTVVLRSHDPPVAAAGGDTLAVRMPAHRRLLELLRRLETPVTATSANPSGGEALRDPREVGRLLSGRPAAVIDDGVLPGGLPSTMVAWEAGRWRILRPGAYPGEELERRTAESGLEIESRG